MGRLKFLRESDVRHRAREIILAEANYITATDKTSTKSWTASAVRNRGYTNEKGERVNETADATMSRLMRDVDNARPGDTFYLTYALSEFTALGSATAELVDPTGGPAVQYTTKTLTNTLRGLMGEYQGSTADFFSTDEKKSGKEGDLRESKSALATGQDMIMRGMKAIMDTQANRIRQLEEVLGDIEGDNPMTPDQAAQALLRIIDVNTLGVTGKVNTKELARAVSDKIAKGQVRLTDQPAERQIINGGIAMAIGEYVFREARNTTGVIGQGSRVSLGNGTQDVVNPVTAASAERLRDEIMRFASGNAMDSRMIQERAIDILTGCCASNCNFDVGGLTQTAGHMHGRLEKSGLPVSVLMQTIEILLLVMTFGDQLTGSMTSEGKRVQGAWSRRHLPESLLGSFCWGAHVDPEQAVRIARTLDLQVSGSARDAMVGLTPGDRRRKHYSPEVNAVISAYRDLADESGAADPGAVRVRVSELLGREITPSQLGELMKAVKGISTVKGIKANLKDPESRKGRDKKLNGTNDALHADPAEILARAVNIVRENAAGKTLNETFLSRMLYGVTLRCVGRRSGTVITRDRLQQAMTAGTDAGSIKATSSEVPIFDAFVELPKQRRTTTIEDIDQLAKMQVQRESEIGSSKVSYSDAMEGSGKVRSPDDITRTLRRKGTHQSILATTNFNIKLTSEQMLDAFRGVGDIRDALRGENAYTVMSPFKQIFVEKVRSRRKNVTSDFVLQIESLLTSNLTPKTVTVQLLGAKKFSDPAHANERVSWDRMKPIPALGIAGSGIAEKFTLSAANLPGETGLVPAASYDVIDRIMIDTHRTHKMRVAVRNTLDQIQRSLETHDDPGLVNHMERIGNELRSDMQSSHGRSSARFETLVSSRLISRSIRGLVAELHTIRNSDDASITPKIGEMMNSDTANSLSAGAIRRVYDAGAARQITSDESARLESIVDFIKRQFTNEIGVRETDISSSVLPISSIILAALKPGREARSKSDIETHLSLVSPTIAQAAGASKVPQVQSILPRIHMSRIAAESAEEMVKGLKLDEISRSIDGIVSPVIDIHPDLRAGESTVPIEVMQAITSARTSFETVSGPSYDSTIDEISDFGVAALESLSAFCSQLNASAYGKATAKDGKREVSEVNDPGDLKRDTVIGTFVGMALNFAGHAKSNSRVDVTELQRFRNASADAQETQELLEGFLTEVLPMFIDMDETPMGNLKSATQDLIDAISECTALIEVLEELTAETARISPDRTKPPPGQGDTWREFYNKHRGQLAREEEMLSKIADVEHQILSILSSEPNSDLSERALANMRRVITLRSLEVKEAWTTATAVMERLVGVETGFAPKIIADIAITFSDGQRAQVMTNLSISVGAMTTDPGTFARDYKETAGINGEQLLVIKSIMGETDEINIGFIDPYEVARRIINGNPRSELSKLLISSMFPTASRNAVVKSGGVSPDELGRREALRQRVKDVIEARGIMAGALAALRGKAIGERQGRIFAAMMAIGDYLNVRTVPIERQRVDPFAKSIYNISSREEAPPPEVIVRGLGDRVKADRASASRVAADRSPTMSPVAMDAHAQGAERLRSALADNPDAKIEGVALATMSLGKMKGIIDADVAHDEIQPALWSELVAVVPLLLEGMAALIAYKMTLKSGDKSRWDEMLARGEKLASDHPLDDAPDEIDDLIATIRKMPTPEGWQV